MAVGRLRALVCRLQLIWRDEHARFIPIHPHRHPSRGIIMSARAFARVDGQGNLISHSPQVIGMRQCQRSSSGRPVRFGAYCFKLSFTPVSVIANSIAHPTDTPFGPIPYTAGPNVSGRFTKDGLGADIECPAGFQDAAVICRVQAGDGLSIAPGGFFVIFD